MVRTLTRKVEDTLPNVQHALDPSTALPQSCPDHVALALMELREVEKPLSEVVGILKMVEDRIRSGRGRAASRTS